MARFRAPQRNLYFDVYQSEEERNDTHATRTPCPNTKISSRVPDVLLDFCGSRIASNMHIVYLCISSNTRGVFSLSLSLTRVRIFGARVPAGSEQRTRGDDLEKLFTINVYCDFLRFFLYANLKFLHICNIIMRCHFYFALNYPSKLLNYPSNVLIFSRYNPFTEIYY